jgi:hypothetical protein
MSDLKTKYDQRLRKRAISSLDVTRLKGRTGSRNRKFEPNGKARPFYGLTCIAWIDQQSKLFQELGNLQCTLREALENAELSEIFSFLAPESFHMTICDIEASPAPMPKQQFDRYVGQVQLAFQQIGVVGTVVSQVRSIGLTTTINALVRFNDEPELKKVFDMEQKIKQATGVNVRDFTGHISLAYFVQHPGDNAGKIKEILRPHEDTILGDFLFSQFDLTYFTDMNSYIPVLTIDLRDETVTRHSRRVLVVSE